VLGLLSTQALTHMHIHTRTNMHMYICVCQSARARESERERVCVCVRAGVREAGTVARDCIMWVLDHDFNQLSGAGLNTVLHCHLYV